MALTRSQISIRYHKRHHEKWKAYRRLHYARKVGKAEPGPPRHITDCTLQITQRRAFLKWLKDIPCTDCGTRYPAPVMEFDHVTDDKLRPVGLMIFGSMDVLVDEIRKCELVCANCHRIRTHTRRLARRTKKSVA